MSEVKQPQDHLKKQGQLVVGGIKLDIPRERMEDWDVVECIATVQDDGADQGVKLVAIVRVMKLLFADDYERVKSELRASNDGHLTMETMSKFMTDAFEQINPNS